MKKIDIKKLKKVKEQKDGAYQAQCPACAADGNDKKGEHLRIFKDGKFGCAVGKTKAHKALVLEVAGSESTEPGGRQQERPELPKLRIIRMVCPPVQVLDVYGRPGRLISTSCGRSEEKENGNEYAENVEGLEKPRPGCPPEEKPTQAIPKAPTRVPARARIQPVIRRQRSSKTKEAAMVQSHPVYATQRKTPISKELGVQAASL